MPRRTPVVEDWLNHKFSTGCYPGEDYLKFQKAARRDLRKIAKSVGFKLLKFNPNHYEFSAVLQNESNGSCVYVAISDVRHPWWYDDTLPWWYKNVLYRTMKNESDWRGGPNHWCSWNELSNTLTHLSMDETQAAAV